MAHLLALDQGTTSSRAIVFDAAGAIRATAQKELRQLFPQPGWVEHDPLDIWRDQLDVARAALRQAGLAAGDIAAIGIANQRETVVLWERAGGRPLHNAIVWQDRRTAEACARLRAEGAEATLREKTGLVLDPYFSATKLAWLLDHVPNARERARRGELAAGTIDSWLAWNLTGGRLHVTDPSNASRTSLFDIHRGDWDDALLALFDVPREILPRVVRSSAPHGETESGLFGAAIQIGGMAGDQQAALFGQACHDAGMAKNTYGTGCFLLMHTGGRALASRNGLITTCAAQTGATPEYALEGSVFIGGAVVQWLRDGLGLIKSAAEVEALAAGVADAGGVVFVPAFAGLGAPHWNTQARGTLVGLTRGTTAAHIARAALEAIAFQSAELVEAMAADCGRPLADLRVDGGATANGLLMQFQADLLGVPVLRPRIQETTALGAAYLAGLAAGVWKNRADIAAHWARERVFAPALPRDDAVARMAQWRRAVSSALTFAA
ncbi:MAG: glycerol kinase GlpK [Betaproteobacteria bacterium]|nr:glycerol kinase GlpK [Betaproteobacteria bacterium]